MRMMPGVKSGAVIVLLLFCCFSRSVCLADDSADAFQQQQKYLEAIKNESPRLYEFEKRISEIQENIRVVIEQIQRGRMTKEEARKALTPLFKELISIQQNQDYLLERQLFSILGQSSISE